MADAETAARWLAMAVVCALCVWSETLVPMPPRLAGVQAHGRSARPNYLRHASHSLTKKQ